MPTLEQIRQNLKAGKPQSDPAAATGNAPSLDAIRAQLKARKEPAPKAAPWPGTGIPGVPVK